MSSSTSLPISSVSSVSSVSSNRERIFLDSSDPSMPNQVILHNSTSPSFIKLPFPPCIDPYKILLDRKKDGNMDHTPVKTPNAFLLYRKIFVECAQKEGYRLPMTVISSMASKSWKNESDIVKAEYKRISKQILEIRNQIFPKSERKKGREKWNLVTFSKANKTEKKITRNKLHHHHHQNKSIQQQEEEEQEESIENFNYFNPDLKTTNLFSSELGPLNDDELNENVLYSSNTTNQLPNLNFQMYDQKSENYANYSYISQNDNKNIVELENYVDITNRNQLNNNNTNYSTTNYIVDSNNNIVLEEERSLNSSIMENSNYYK